MKMIVSSEKSLHDVLAGVLGELAIELLQMMVESTLKTGDQSVDAEIQQKITLPDERVLRVTMTAEIEE